MACFRLQESALYWRSVVCWWLLRGFIDRWMSGNIVGGTFEVHGFSPFSSVGEEKATSYPVRNGGRTSKMISFCNSWEFESDIFGSLLRPLTGSHESSTLVEQKSLERLRVLLLGFSTGFFHATRSSMQSSSKTALFTYLKKFYC